MIRERDALIRRLAGALAMLVPVSGGAYVLLEPNGLGTGPARWVFVGGTIEYRHNVANAPAGIDGPGLVDQAFDTWTNVPSANIAFSRGADTTLAGFDIGDGVNVITWEDPNDNLETGVLAAASTFAPSGTHGYQGMNFFEITQSDIIFNDGVTWTDSDGASLLGGCLSGKFDVEAVALHEVGHLLGLDHPSGNYASAIMFGSIDDCDATRTSPKIDDVNAVTFLYDSGTPPVYPAFTLDDDEGYAPLTVAFSDASTGTVTSHSWAFGDGSSATSANPTHEYVTPGLFDVTLTVNGSAAIERVDVVTVYQRPTVEFSADMLEGDAPLTVTFTNESTDEGADPRFRWQLDGQTIFDENIQHEFEDPGTYTVTLSVDAGAGYVPNEKENYIRVRGEKEDELFPGCSCAITPAPSRRSHVGVFFLAGIGCFLLRRRLRVGE